MHVNVCLCVFGSTIISKHFKINTVEVLTSSILFNDVFKLKYQNSKDNK